MNVSYLINIISDIYEYIHIIIKILLLYKNYIKEL